MSETQEIPSANPLRQEFDKLVIQRPKAATRRGQFMEGLAAPLTGMKFVMARKGYLRSFVFPIVIQTLVSVGLIAILLMTGRLLTEWLHSGIMAIVEYFKPGAANEAVSQWATIALYALMFVLLLYGFQLAWRVTGGILDDYFGDQITNRIMTDLGIETVRPANSMLQTIFNTGKSVAVSHAVMLVCSPLSAVPVIGTLAVLAAGSTTMLFLKGADELSDPLMSLGLTRKEAFSLCKRHKWTAMGLAMSKAGLEPFPVIVGAFSAAAAAESVGRIAVAMRLLELDKQQPA